MLIRANALQALARHTGKEGKAVRTCKTYAREVRAQAVSTDKALRTPSTNGLPAQHKTYAQINLKNG